MINDFVRLSHFNVLVKYFDLSKFDMNKRIANYSHGMKQKIGLIASLIHDPDIWILDEPTVGLDIMTYTQLAKLIVDLREKGRSIFIASHNIDLVSEISDRVCVMYAGKIAELASNEDIYKNAKHPYTKRLLKATPRLNKAVSKLEFIEGTPPDLLNPPKGCMFYERCKERIDKCKNEEPIIKDIGNGHLCACHLVD